MSPSAIRDAAAPSAAVPPTAPRLLDVIRDTGRRQGHDDRTISAFRNWVTLFVRYHGRRHPRELQLAEIYQFLEQVGKTARDPLTAIEEARLALEFLYRDVLCRDLGELPRPQPPRLLDQVRQVLRVRHYALATEACYVDCAPGRSPGRCRCHAAIAGATCVGQLTSIGSRVLGCRCWRTGWCVCVEGAMQTIFGSQPWGGNVLGPRACTLSSIQEFLP
jgi:hypothetical protein